MNYTVLIYGLIHRSLNYTIDSFRECVISPLSRLGKVTIYYHSWDVRFLRNFRTQECHNIDIDCIQRLLPDATGIVDSESHFDANVNWEMLERNNRSQFSGPLNTITFKNIVRSLESLNRVWRLYSTRSNTQSDLLVATRADLRFRSPLKVPDSLPQTLWVPDFHDWGGCNDRFAVGDEEAMKVYCHRRQFYEHQLPNVQLDNPEKVLQAWLEFNSVNVHLIPVRFQRIRADGTTWHKDRVIS